ncbi:MAG: NADH-quinone oxidoreductase subunit L, partial [bacterium]|nr:NADH-quinone oxidoreductase subunit L [bacterium]
IPETHWTMFAASLAIAGIPGLAGFFSKDEILWQAWSSPFGSKALWAVGIVTALMTAFYMWRLMYMTFYGSGRMDEETEKHIHESPKVMTVPLMILAVGSVIGGWIGVPKLWGMFGEGFRLFEHWLEPVFATATARLAEGQHGHHDTTVEWLLMGLSIALAVAGILLARHFYGAKTEVREPIRQASPGLYKILLNKWYVDELYDFLFVNGLS